MRASVCTLCPWIQSIFRAIPDLNNRGYNGTQSRLHLEWSTFKVFLSAQICPKQSLILAYAQRRDSSSVSLARKAYLESQVRPKWVLDQALLDLDVALIMPCIGFDCGLPSLFRRSVNRRWVRSDWEMHAIFVVYWLGAPAIRRSTCWRECQSCFHYYYFSRLSKHVDAVAITLRSIIQASLWQLGTETEQDCKRCKVCERRTTYVPSASPWQHYQSWAS